MINENIYKHGHCVYLKNSTEQGLSWLHRVLFKGPEKLALTRAVLIESATSGRTYFFPLISTSLSTWFSSLHYSIPSL